MEESPIATVIIRGSTDNVMDDVERALDDGVNTFKALTKVRTVEEPQQGGRGCLILPHAWNLRAVI